jgi:hypothetical protein
VAGADMVGSTTVLAVGAVGVAIWSAGCVGAGGSLGVADALSVGAGVADALSVGSGVIDAVIVGAGVAVGVGVRVGLGVAVGKGDAVGSGAGPGSIVEVAALAVGVIYESVMLAVAVVAGVIG